MSTTRRTPRRSVGIRHQLMVDAARAVSKEIPREDALEFLRIAAIVSPTQEDLEELRKMLAPHAGRLARLGFIYSDLV